MLKRSLRYLVQELPEAKIFLIILLASLLLRLTRFDFPSSYTFAWGDGTRDFLVASHILKYQEFPKFGPYNLLQDSGVHNSPIYFYVLSFFLLLYNNILTLSLVNIFLQILVIVLLFLITRKIFGYKTAIVAILLFSFNPEVIKQADFVWQPYLMLPFALLALYFKIKQRHLTGLALLCFASLFHFSGFPWIVPFIFFSRGNIKFYLIAAALIFLTLLLSLSGYFTNFSTNLGELLKTFYINSALAILLLIGFLVAFKKAPDKKLMIFLSALFLSPLILASLFDKIRLHYIILSMVTLPILVAKITEIFQPTLRVVVVIGLLLVFSGGYAYLKDAKAPLENQAGFNNLTEVVALELEKAKQREAFSDFDFFQILSLMRTESDTQRIIPYPVLDTFLLIGLEEKFNKKLATVSDQSPYNHIQINKKDYLVVSCFKSAEDDMECINYFKNMFKDYNILKKVYNAKSLSIYLAKHEQI